MNDIFVFQEIDWNNEWHPKIVFFNALETEKFQINHFWYVDPVDAVPFAVKTFRVKGTFRENLKLQDFPLDYQV